MKGLVTLSFVFDVEDGAELADIATQMEARAVEELVMTLGDRGLGWADLDGLVEFYGVSVTVQKEQVA